MGTRRKTDEEIAGNAKKRHERYRAKNHESIKLRTDEWKRENKEKLSEKRKHRYKSDAAHKLRVICRNRIGGALKSAKSIKTMDLVGCTGQELKMHLERQFKRGMSWENYGTHWHVDHIVPCASFDLSKESHQIRCFHYSNLQPLKAIENLRKNKTPPAKHKFALL
jgi:hypothetical protein